MAARWRTCTAYKRRHCIGIVVALACEAVAAQSAATAASDDAQSFDKVVITGSHIPQIDRETALPVQVIRREEIDRLGVTTAAQLLERVPANVNGLNDALSVGNGSNPGMSSANLRGLGSGSTLVLLNGRRLANYAFDGASVDLNSIPLSAVERVEVLKDGASAIYGSDALAGVINFILRKDYAGAELTAYAAVTQEGGGNSAQIIGSFGVGSLQRDRYNVFLSVAYQQDQALKAIDRTFSSTAYRPDLGIDGLNPITFPANIADRPRRRFINPTYAQGCSPPTSLPLDFVGLQACGYDYATAIDLIPDLERSSLLGRATWRLNADTDVFAEALLTRNTTRTSIAATPVSPTTAFGPTLYPADGPYYPTAFAAANGVSGALQIAYRAVELGSRVNDIDSDSQRYLVGVEGAMAGWSYNVAAAYSRNTQSDTYANGYLDLSKFIPAMGTGLINPWGPSGPEGQALVESSLFYGTLRNAVGTTSLLNAYASREITALAAGPLSVAFGAETRRERLSDDWDPIVTSGSGLFSTTPPSVSGSRTVYALFAELSVPIVRNLDAQLAVRWDDYSDFGSTTNPKVALRWQPISALLLRGSWGTGFRAPPLYNLFSPAVTSLDFGVRDPIRCPVTGLPDDCDAFIEVVNGGNPDLQPETSTQWNLGVVLEPVRGLSVGVDYWNIKQDDTINVLWWDTALTYFDKYGDRFIRGPVDPATPGLPGPIIGYDARLMNLGSTRTSGIDVSFIWNVPKQDWGTVRVALQGTYVLQWETQFDSVNYVSLLGTDIFDGAIPRWRNQLTFDWNYGPWAATLAQTYTSSYTDASFDPDGATRKVQANSVWDVQCSYTGFTGWQLAGGIRNLFNVEPPISNQRGTFQIGYDPQLSSPLGRVYYLRVTYSWK